MNSLSTPALPLGSAATVTRLDANPRAAIDELLAVARGCVALASRPDLLRQGVSAPDAGAYALKAEACLDRVYALERFLVGEQRLMLAYVERTLDRLCDEERRRVSPWIAPVIDLRTRRVLNGQPGGGLAVSGSARG